MKDIKCTIKSIVKHGGAQYCGQENVTLEAALVVPYQFGEFSGDLLIVDGYYAWNLDHYTLLLDKDRHDRPLWGMYVLHGDTAYLLSRHHLSTAHAALEFALNNLGTPLIDWIARIDELEAHPACAEEVPA